MRFLRVLIIEGRLLWLTLGSIVVLVVAPGLWTCSGETRLRFAAMFLQLLGIVLVAIGIRDSRSLFARPSLWQHTLTWMCSLGAALRPRLKHVSASATINFEADGTGRTTSSAIVSSAPRTVEERIAALAEELNQLRQQSFARHEALDSQVKTMAKRIEVEAKERRDSDGHIRALLEAEAAGGLHLEVIGLCWLIVGTIVGSLNGELGPLFEQMSCVR